MSSYAGGAFVILIYGLALYIVYIIVCGIVAKKLYDAKKFDIPDYGYYLIFAGSAFGVPLGIVVIYKIYNIIIDIMLQAEYEKNIDAHPYAAAAITST